MKFSGLCFYTALAASARATSAQEDPECAAKENGAEVFPAGNPVDQLMKVESTIDTDTCTYDITVSYAPNSEVPFVDSPRGGVGRPPRLDVPGKFREMCDADGYQEDATQSAGMPGGVLDPVSHTGTNEYYTEHSYSIYTSDKVAEMTGVKDVVLGAAPCGQGQISYPQSSVHFYHTSMKDERLDYRCVTGGGFFCKPWEEQCSERGLKFNMGAATGGPGAAAVYCDPANPAPFTNEKNLPAGYTWTVDIPPAGVLNAAVASQGLHGINLQDFGGQPAYIPKHLLLQYDGELVANHIVISAGFSKGYSDKNQYVKDFDWENGSCVDPSARKLATKMSTEYDPETGRTHVTAHGPLKDCSGESFTDVIDHSGGARPKSSKSAKKSKSAKFTPTPEPEPESTCGHQKVTFLEAPESIVANRFNGAGVGVNGFPVSKAGDFTAYQDRFFKFEDISEANHAAFNAIYRGMRVGYLQEVAGQHRGVDFHILNQTGVGPASIGGYAPNLALAEIEIDHPDHGTGTIKITGYAPVFGEGELAIVGGTGDFFGAIGSVRPYYGAIYYDEATLADNGLFINPGLTLGASAVDGTPLTFGFYLDIDFYCRG